MVGRAIGVGDLARRRGRKWGCGRGRHAAIRPRRSGLIVRRLGIGRRRLGSAIEGGRGRVLALNGRGRMRIGSVGVPRMGQRATRAKDLLERHRGLTGRRRGQALVGNDGLRAGDSVLVRGRNTAVALPVVIRCRRRGIMVRGDWLTSEVYGHCERLKARKQGRAITGIGGAGTDRGSKPGIGHRQRPASWWGPDGGQGRERRRPGG